MVCKFVAGILKNTGNKGGAAALDSSPAYGGGFSGFIDLCLCNAGG